MRNPNETGISTERRSFKDRLVETTTGIVGLFILPAMLLTYPDPGPFPQNPRPRTPEERVRRDEFYRIVDRILALDPEVLVDPDPKQALVHGMAEDAWEGGRNG